MRKNRHVPAGVVPRCFELSGSAGIGIWMGMNAGDGMAPPQS